MLTTGENAVIDKPYVERRVKDWQKRVSGLYKQMQHWLQGSEYSLKISPIKFKLYEKHMYDVGLKPVKMDILIIYKGPDFVGSVEPFGLWINGSNGALELYAQAKIYKILDLSHNFSKPDWKVVESRGWDEHRAFNKTRLLSILKG
jgi:hypothetical protein